MTVSRHGNGPERALRAHSAHTLAFVLVVLAASMLAMTPVAAAVQDATLVSKVDPSMIHAGAGAGAGVGTRTNGGRAVSADGRYVVFVSDAPNVVAAQVPNLFVWPRSEVERSRTINVFLYDRIAATTTLVSHVPGAPTTAANDDSYAPTSS